MQASAPPRPQAAYLLCELSASALCVEAIYFTSASFPFSILITAISLGSTPFFWAQ